MKRFGLYGSILGVLVTAVGSTVFAQGQQSITTTPLSAPLPASQCAEDYQEARYYVGTPYSTYDLSDTFTENNTNLEYIFDTTTNVRVYNPVNGSNNAGMIDLAENNFPWVSTIRPAVQTVGYPIPSVYVTRNLVTMQGHRLQPSQRETTAAQIVFQVHRRHNNGTQYTPNTANFLGYYLPSTAPLWDNPLVEYYQPDRPIFISSTATSGNECINYYLSRCGDGVKDDNSGNPPFAKTSNADGDEFCDDGNTNNNDYCNNECERNFPSCGLADGQIYYAFGNNGQALSSGDLDLCPPGQEAVSRNWDPVSHTFTWGCQYIGAPSGAPVSRQCEATESRCGDGVLGTGINYLAQEQCDDGNTDNNDGCNNLCQINAGSCGPLNGGAYYDDDEPPLGDVLTGGTPGLCPPGQILVNGLNYNGGYWTRQCQRPGGPASSTCAANEDYCGDELIQANFGEACDDGNNDNDDACNNECQRNEPACGPADDEIYYAFGDNGQALSSGDADLCPLGQEAVNRNRNPVTHTFSRECQYIDAPRNAPTSSVCEAAESRCGDGVLGTGINYLSQEQCDDGNTDNDDACTNLCQINAGSCGVASGQTYYDDVEPPLGDEIDEDHPDLCPAGQDAVNFVYDAVLGQWTWNCIWPDGPEGPLCKAYEDYCGDDIVQANFGEACDDGNNENDDACNNACQRNVPACGPADGGIYYDDAEPPLGDELLVTDPDLCPVGQEAINFVYDAVAGERTWQCRYEYPGAPLSLQCSADEDYCGDGIANGTPVNPEACDDGNSDPDDGCNNECQISTGLCGITNGETFYDDNHPPLGDEIDEDYPDLCPSGQDVVNFVYDPVLEQWTRQCQWPNGDPGLQCVAYEDHCGDGITQTTFGETCDDGNNLPNDGCSPTCQLEEPGCGVASGEIYYGVFPGVSLDETMGTILCPVGQDVIPGSFFYDTMTATYSWECDFANGTSPATCEAYDSRCGDGIIGTGIGYPQFGNEECDENGNNGVPCIPGYGGTCTYCSLNCEEVVVEGGFCGDGLFQDPPEECDLSSPVNICANGLTCTSQCSCEDMSLGSCGFANGQVYYAFGNNGQALDESSQELCPLGQTLTPNSFTFANGVFSWTCDGPGGTGPICYASESRCGDGILGTGINYTPGLEECDDDGNNGTPCVPGYEETCAYCTVWCEEELLIGPYCGDGIVQPQFGEECDDNGNLPGDGCSPDCQLEEPGQCGTTYSGQYIYDLNNAGDALTINTPGLCVGGLPLTFVYDTINHAWVWTCPGDNGGNAVSCQARELRCGNNTIDPNSPEECDGSNFGCVGGEECNLSVCQCVVEGNDGVCGPVHYSTIYDFDNAGDIITAQSPGLCAAGDVVSFVYDTFTHSWSWWCEGTNGGSSAYCVAAELRCGNYIVDVNSPESCDGGPTGNDPVNCAPNELCVACQCEVQPPECGNGIVEAGEQCDDGNSANDDLCNDQCQWTVCGDGIVQNPNGVGGMEECDDGNPDNDDLCANDCTINEPSECTYLAINYTPSSLPWIVTYQCVGNGDVVEVILYDGQGNPIATADTPTGTFELSDVDTYQIVCSYDGVTSPACQQTVPVGGYCEDLTAQGMDQTYTFTCDGVGSFFEIIIYDDLGNVETSASSNSSFSYTYTFTDPGTYTAICFVDGQTGRFCPDAVTPTSPGGPVIDTVAPTTPIKPTDTTPTTTTVSPTSVTPPDSTTLSPTSPTSPTTTTPTPTPNTVLSPDSSTLHTTTKDAVTEANPEEDVAPDVKVGEDDLLAKTPTEDTRITSTPEREATTKDGFQIQSALTTSAPTTLIKPITTTSTTTTTTIPPDSLVPSVGCYNPCLEVITITIPEPECKIALDPPAVVITGSLPYQVQVTCAFGNTNGVPGIDCGNGEDPVIDVTTTTCIYTTTGSFTPTCLLDKEPFPGCEETIKILPEGFCGDGMLDPGEECDGTAGTCPDPLVCNQAVCLCVSAPDDGVCGPVNDSQIYDFDNTGDALDVNSPGLCAFGLPTIFSYNPVTHTWSWECPGTNGGSTATCSATELWCGNGIVETGEACDDGNTENHDSCTNLCTVTMDACYGEVTCDGWLMHFAHPLLDDVVIELYDETNTILLGYAFVPATNNPSTTVTGSRLIMPQLGSEIHRFIHYLGGTKTFTSIMPLDCPMCGNGVLDPGEECDGTAGTCPDPLVCNQAVCLCVSAPEVGLCGPVDGTQIYDLDNAGDALTGGSVGLCAIGTATNFMYDPVTHSWSWECVVSGGGTGDQCEAFERRCGNFVVDPNSVETCDDGNTVNGDGCSSICQTEDPEQCPDPITNFTVNYPVAPTVNTTSSATLTLSGTVAGNVSQVIVIVGSQMINAPIVNGIWSATVTFDTGVNLVWIKAIHGSGDPACNAVLDLIFDYQPLPVCGNGLIEAGEQCDGDDAVCGPTAICSDQCLCVYQPICGNGIVDPGEQCDDGNTTNTDQCTNSCTLTFCGDGVQQNPNGQGGNERCDDGNTDNTDACTAWCMETFCGDGIVQTPNAQGQSEACDDGNTIDTDGCTNICQIVPTCGNGVLNPGELCDDGNTMPGDGCNASCQLERCGDQYLDPNGADNLSGTADDEQCEFSTDCPVSGSTCSLTCQCVPPVGPICGNGIVESGEQCDDGNSDNTDSCLNNCTLPSVSACTSLCLSDPDGNVPFTFEYRCHGTGDEVLVELINAQDVVVMTSATASGIFTVMNPGVYEVVCSYDGETSDPCQQVVTVGGYCEELQAVNTSGTTYTFTCEGAGSDFDLIILNANNMVVGVASSTGSFSYTHTFATAGTYTAICFVDGVTNLTCTDGADQQGFSTQSVQTNASSTTIGTMQTSQGVLVSVNDIDYLTYGFTPTQAITDPVVAAAIAQQSVSLVQGVSPSMITPTSTVTLTATATATASVQISTSVPSVLVSPLYAIVLQTTDTVSAQIGQQCINTCQQIVEVTMTPPTSSTCALELDPAIVQISGSTHSVDVACLFSGTNGDPSIACGGGTGTIANYTGTCTYSTTGTYTIACLLDNQIFSGCDATLTLGYTGGTLTGAVCGDGVKTGTEECDDGNLINGDGCNNQCRREGGGGGGGGKKSSVTCGDGKVDPGEQCDDGIKNGWKSICTTSCTLKGIVPRGGGGGTVTTTAGDEIPKCAFVDPPSIQLGERLPFWWEVEDDAEVTTVSTCDASSAGHINKDTLQCHFTILAPDGKTVALTRSCAEDDLKDAAWYYDLQQDLQTTLAPSRGQSMTDSSTWGMSVYGEYAIVLDKITYDICIETTPGDAERAATYAMAYNQSYDGRVCQFNFAVTTPYLMQKGATFSSLVDDQQTLQRFLRFDGRGILDFGSVDFLTKPSTITAFDSIKQMVDESRVRAIQSLDVVHPIGVLSPYAKKVPNQELYVIDDLITLKSFLNNSFNDGKPTTIIVPGARTVTIEGSLPGNLLLLVPDGEVVFVNNDCDRTDTVDALIVARAVKTRTVSGVLGNNSLSAPERCTDGKLRVRGLLITTDAETVAQLRLARRSTLNNWFKGDSSKAEHIYEGASLRIDARPAIWTNQPPLAKNDALVFTTQTHQSADETVLPPLGDAVIQSLFVSTLTPPQRVANPYTAIHTFP